jgi:hypothetical protein
MLGHDARAARPQPSSPAPSSRLIYDVFSMRCTPTSRGTNGPHARANAHQYCASSLSAWSVIAAASSANRCASALVIAPMRKAWPSRRRRPARTPGRAPDYSAPREHPVSTP